MGESVRTIRQFTLSTYNAPFSAALDCEEHEVYRTMVATMIPASLWKLDVECDHKASVFRFVIVDTKVPMPHVVPCFVSGARIVDDEPPSFEVVILGRSLDGPATALINRVHLYEGGEEIG